MIVTTSVMVCDKAQGDWNGNEENEESRGNGALRRMNNGRRADTRTLTDRRVLQGVLEEDPSKGRVGRSVSS
ncbi:unnamed protein product [Arctogadus glacialis]